MTVSPKSAAAGSTVTVSLQPDFGKQTDEIIVTDKAGQQLPLAKKGDSYCFQQPRGGSTVTVTFSDVKWNNPFTDVSPDDWFYEDVALCHQLGLLNGASNTIFAPQAMITRGMTVAILYRLEGEPQVSETCPFADVQPGSYYAQAITWAAASNLVKGYDQARFGPDAPVSREQMAAILYRYAQFKGYDISLGEGDNILSCRDAWEISPYALPALEWAWSAGLMQGDGENLRPTAVTQRCQAAALLIRFRNTVGQ